MPLNISDKKIDRELEQIVSNLKRLGIKASKTDAIRYILNIKQQGKKTNRNWGRVL